MYLSIIYASSFIAVTNVDSNESGQAHVMSSIRFIVPLMKKFIS